MQFRHIPRSSEKLESLPVRGGKQIAIPPRSIFLIIMMMNMAEHDDDEGVEELFPLDN